MTESVNLFQAENEPSLPLLKNPQLGKVEGGFTYGKMMFADISGFTAISEKLSRLGKEGAEEITAIYGIDEIIEELEEMPGAEEAAPEITAILNSHFTTVRGIIARYGGVVNKPDSYAVGHRIMALFGAPRAHIDDPERAVRAALDMQGGDDALRRPGDLCGLFFLKRRIGVNTGLVFAGNVGSPVRQEYSVMGDGVDLAARLVAVAHDGQVIISRDTARQTGDRFLHLGDRPLLVLSPAQYLGNENNGVERLFSEMRFAILYAPSDEEDFIPPAIWEVNEESGSDNEGRLLRVPAQDDSGIERVLVTYSEDGSLWHGRELTCDRDGYRQGEVPPRG